MGEECETRSFSQNYLDHSTDLGEALARGSEVLTSGPSMPDEIVMMDPEGLATYARRHEESARILEVTVGLRVVGVLRREKAFSRRQLVECAAVDVRLGDKIVLETSDGEQITTKKMRIDWGANIQAKVGKIQGRYKS